MKKSQKVAIGLVTLIAGGGIGTAAVMSSKTSRVNGECVDRQTGQVVHTDQCDSSYRSGYTGGRYGYRYKNKDGSTSLVDAGDRSAVSARGGFGDGSSVHSGSSGS